MIKDEDFSVRQCAYDIMIDLIHYLTKKTVETRVIPLYINMCNSLITTVDKISDDANSRTALAVSMTVGKFLVNVKAKLGDIQLSEVWDIYI